MSMSVEYDPEDIEESSYEDFEDDEPWYLPSSSDEEQDFSPEQIHPGLSHDDRIYYPPTSVPRTIISDLAKVLSSDPQKKSIVLNIFARLDASPHIGNIFTWTTAFLLAHKLKSERNQDLSIILDVEEPVALQEVTVDNFLYWRTQRNAEESNGRVTEEVRGLMSILQWYTGIECRLRRREEVLKDPAILEVIRRTLSRLRNDDSPPLPSTGPGIHLSCPAEGCGLICHEDTWDPFSGSDSRLSCPNHGEYLADISHPEVLQRLDFDKQVWNFIRTTIQQQDSKANWINITGYDHSTSYTLHPLPQYYDQPPLVFHTPIILDWSGARISKSLHTQKGAYEYLKYSELEFLLSYEKFREERRELQVVVDEVMNWLKRPHKLFRSYSLEYVHTLFRRAEERFPLGSSIGAYYDDNI